MDRKVLLGSKVREWRKQKNLTQEELGIKISRSTEAISMIERGLNSPSSKTIIALSKILGIPVNEFYKSYEFDANDHVRNKVMDRIIGMLHNMDIKKLEIVEKQVRALADL